MGGDGGEWGYTASMRQHRQINYTASIPLDDQYFANKDTKHVRFVSPTLTFDWSTACVIP